MKLLVLSLSLIPLSAAVDEARQKMIDAIAGVKGTYNAAEDVYRITFPRADLKVTVEGRAMAPFMGFTAWAAFTSHRHGQLMVMGDMVLLEDEVNPAMSAALDNGLGVTALHNHFFYERPRVMFMHIDGHGDAATLARGVKAVQDAIRNVRAKSATPGTNFGGVDIGAANAITPGPLDAILGVEGEVNNGMYKATIGRPATMHGTKVGKLMGVNTWAAFAGTDDSALVDGDFAMTNDELNGVLKSLRRSGINVVAIHNHMTEERPQYVFLHYWGKGKAGELARALKAAMDTQRKSAARR